MFSANESQAEREHGTNQIKSGLLASSIQTERFCERVPYLNCNVEANRFMRPNA